MDFSLANHQQGTGADAGSDYGSDFTAEEEELVNKLLAKLPSEDDTPSNINNIEYDEEPGPTRMPRILGHERRSRSGTPLTEIKEARASVEVECNSSATNVESDESRAGRQRSVTVEPSTDTEAPDIRSPLERFRTAPKKALSVTDLISPSWCELQYWYTLTKHGRKKRTPAMRQGSAVHKTLEDEVHKSVAVSIETKEDAWGLRIWNIIQGLRTLRDTGMTRELEIWGVIDGLVVNGVIDELSYVCPDRELEEEVTARTAHGKGGKKAVSADQTSITDFLKSPSSGSGLKNSIIRDIRKITKPSSKIYLTDVKTRGTRSIPKGASFRPTLMQLMLYRHLLSNLATNRVDADVLFNRYELKSSATFTDGFITQVGSLNEVFYDAPAEPSQSEDLPASSQDSLQILLDNNSLKQLWALMIHEFQRTMPLGFGSIGDVLKAEYRDQVDGSILGIKTFVHDDGVLKSYLEDEMRWWRGEREAQGVSIEEAYKCRICEFAEGCTWRKAKIEEATEAHRTRSRSVV
ncbi:MAG: hypothetical protein M1830_001132 [Pleopsidium flavum]|nr:MAG: hypothetical protein M1830_001132 [Pleopsidium flavum]